MRIFKKIISLFILLFYMLLVAEVTTAQTADNEATQETRYLLNNLHKQLTQGIMFGHQNDLAYGVGWKYEGKRSDVKETAGQYQAVYEWELGRLEIDAAENLDGVSFNKMKQYIADAYQCGGMITISWHLNNPLTGKTAWEFAHGTVESILPRGSKNELYKSCLDKKVAFFLHLKAKKGEFIPVIFRPFDEQNGSWFWWGKNHCTLEQLKQLCRFTETYLQEVKNVHNLLDAFNTDRFDSIEAYLERYPGDAYVDIMGFDIYQKGDILVNDKLIAEVDKSLTLLEKMAADKNKIPALTDFGYNTVPDSLWWTNVFYKALKKHTIAYVLAWRNAGKKSTDEMEFYMPYKGQLSATNFKIFTLTDKIIFEK